LTIFLPFEISTSFDIHVPFSLLQIITSGLCGSVGLHLLFFVTTNFSTCAYQCSLSDFTPISFNMLQCSSAHTLSCLMCTVLLPVISMLILCVLLSHQIVDIICICYLFLFVIFLLHDVLFLMPDLVLLLVLFQFFKFPLYSHRNIDLVLLLLLFCNSFVTLSCLILAVQ